MNFINTLISNPLVIEPFPVSSCLPDAPVRVDVLRLDKLHPVVSGNKWFKLKLNLQAAKSQGYKKLISCGGPHSNHLHAFANAAKLFGFGCIALVRGYENLPLTQTLLDCQALGMKLIFVDKKTYLKRYDDAWCEQQAHSNDAYWIPEGGNNELGQQGCAEIAQACSDYDEIWTSIGSGCTYTGLARSLSKNQHLHGIMAIKGGQALAQELLTGSVPNSISKLNSISDIKAAPSLSIDCDHHLGGFGRCPDSLIELIKRYDTLGLPLDPVYTAKMVYAFEQSWLAGALDSDKRYLLIHTGGLQGRRGVAALLSGNDL